MKKINREKLLNCGFEFDGKNFVRRQEFLNQMTLTIIIDAGGSVTTKIIDADGEPYTLHLVEGASGKFVGTVKAEYERILNELAAQCFDDEIFKFEQTLRLIEYVREHFDDAPEFLWEKYPNFAIFRRKDNRKWYALIANIPKRYLKLDGDEELEILNLRVEPEELDELFDGEKYFRGWHMNKRSWMTLRLDDSLTFEELCARLERSYQLASSSRKRDA